MVPKSRYSEATQIRGAVKGAETGGKFTTEGQLYAFMIDSAELQNFQLLLYQADTPGHLPEDQLLGNRYQKLERFSKTWPQSMLVWDRWQDITRPEWTT